MITLNTDGVEKSYYTHEEVIDGICEILSQHFNKPFEEVKRDFEERRMKRKNRAPYSEETETTT